MKIKLDALILNIFLLLGLLYCRQVSTVTNANFGLVVANYLLIFLLLNIGIIKFKLIFNPITLLLPLCIAYLYYGFMISSKQVHLSFDVQASYYLFILFYVVGTFLPFMITSQNKICLSRKKKRFIDFVFVTGFIVFLIECALNGGFPLLITIIGGHNVYADLKYIPILHYLIIVITLMPSIYYYFFKYNFISKLYLYIFSFISIFVVLNQLSRQLLIYGCLAYLITYMKLNNINSAKFLLKFLSIVGIIFMILGRLRLGAALPNAVTELDYLKAYSDVPKSLDVNTFDVTFNLYSSLNFNTLNDMFNKSDGFHYGMYTLKPLLILAHFNDAFPLKYDPDLDGFTRLATVIADPYLDFGILGVIIFSFLYGSILSGAFRSHVISDNLGHTLIWATLSYAMTMAVFANFFNVMTVWICILFSLTFCFTFRWRWVRM